MENASKALIIAGAILLSILIIGLGMTVYNSATSVTGNINLDSQELSAHNSQFTAYSNRQKGTNVSSLLTMIQSNNNEYDDRKITVSLSTSSTPYDEFEEADYEAASFFVDGSEVDGISDVRKKIKSSTTYNVSFDYADNGLIIYCQIEVYTSSGTTDTDET